LAGQIEGGAGELAFAASGCQTPSPTESAVPYSEVAPAAGSSSAWAIVFKTERVVSSSVMLVQSRLQYWSSPQPQRVMTP
jgi:hypothetical protein